MKKEYDNNNIFAKILRKELPAKVVYESENTLCFHTIEKKAKIHLLAIPKKQYTDYHDFVKNASQEEIAAFFKDIAIIAEKEEIGDSYRLVTNYGASAKQEVFHFHVHILRDDIKIF